MYILYEFNETLFALTFSLLCIIVALLFCFSLSRFFNFSDVSGRYGSIDGLRGYLAFAVFLHHGVAWYSYLRGGGWVDPPINLYTHFGQSSVAIFFMITALLFSGKLFDCAGGEVDWIKLFVGRFFRIAPLYFVILFFLMIFVGVASEWSLRSSALEFFIGIIRWAGVGLFGHPDINGVKDTQLIVAGVTWSLRWEWLFYFGLPVLGCFFRIRSSRLLVAVSLCIFFILMSSIFTGDRYNIISFAFGVLANRVSRIERLREFSGTSYASALSVVLIVVTIAAFPSSKGVLPLFALFLIFSLIASGCNLFGVLDLKVSRILGEISYGIYMIHGLLLYIVFNYILPGDFVIGLNIVGHWLAIVFVSPAVVFFAVVSYRVVERPAMSWVSGCSGWLTNFILVQFLKK